MKKGFSILSFFILAGIALTDKSHNTKKIRLIKHLKESAQKRRILNIKQFDITNKNKIIKEAPKNHDKNNSSKNIVNSQNSKKVGSLNDAQIEFHLDENYLRINGVLSPKNFISKNDIIPLRFYEYSKNEKIKKIISCTVIKVEDSKCTLECDNKNQIINTSSIDYNSFESIDDNIYMKIRINQEEQKIETKVVKYVKNNRNNGWSTKSIIGLVVAGAVLVIGAIVLAIILKMRDKSSPPPAQVVYDTNNNLNIKREEIIIKNNSSKV